MESKKITEVTFQKGEEVWFYPEPTFKPRYRKKVKIAHVKVDDFGNTWYMTNDPMDSLMFPTFHSPSQFKKIRKRRRQGK